MRKASATVLSDQVKNLDWRAQGYNQRQGERDPEQKGRDNIEALLQQAGWIMQSSAPF